jgi:hypothetical protein
MGIASHCRCSRRADLHRNGSWTISSLYGEMSESHSCWAIRWRGSCATCGAAATETLTATNSVERLTECEDRDVGFDVCMSHPSTDVRVKRSKMVLCGNSTLWRGLVQVKFASLDNEVFARDGETIRDDVEEKSLVLYHRDARYSRLSGNMKQT